MSALAAAYREMAEEYIRASTRTTSPVLKQEFRNKAEHFHEKAQKWEIKFYPEATKENSACLD